MEHKVVHTKSINIKMFLLRSEKPQRCPVCGLRRILIAIAMHPAGLSPETWMCAEDIGLRIPGVSVDPAPPVGSLPLWPEPEMPVFLPEPMPEIVEINERIKKEQAGE